MARIKINCDGVDSANLILNSIKNNISSIKNDSYSIYLPPIFGSQYNINSRVWNVINRLSTLEYKLDSIKSVTSSASNKYKMVDNQINIRQIAEKISSKVSKVTRRRDGFYDDWGINERNKQKISKIFNNFDETISNEDEKSDNSNVSVKKKIGISAKFDTKNDNGLKSLGIEGKLKGSISALKGEKTWGEEDFATITAKGDVLKAEGEISGKIGILEKTKDGRVVFNPSIGAKIGGSVSVLSGEIKGKLGSDMIGISSKLGATVGKAEADAELKIGLLDESGKFNPSAKVSAKAEAIAAELNAEVGATVLGTDFKVKGAVNYGVGAHAEAGIDNGKIVVDAGVSLGVGVKLGFEVDVSKTVETVTKAVEELPEAIDTVKGAAVCAWNNVTSFFGF